MSQKALSIIIVSYRSRDYLEKCLVSISEKIGTFLDFEVFVVNNGKSDELFGLKKRFSDLVILQTSHNLGFGAANNLAAKKAQGEAFLFLNPDTELISKNIHTLLGEFQLAKKVGVIGGKLVSDTGQIQAWSFGSELRPLSVIWNNLRGFPFHLAEKKRFVGWVSGTALFVRREVFEMLGGFDEEFFMYFEDVDFCRRARLAGWLVEYCPEMVVRHFGGQSYGLKKNEQKSDYYCSQDLYFQKHGYWPVWRILRILRKIL